MAPWALLLPSIVAAAIKAHNFLEGEDLLHDLCDEVRLHIADLERLDAACVDNPNRSDLIVSLTTIPSRITAIGDTLKSLLRQTRSPAEIPTGRALGARSARTLRSRSRRFR